MERQFEHQFEWDPAKALRNAREHGVSFERAATMKPHYDFSKAERGKFYRKGARVRLPICLDSQLQQRLERIAEKKDRDVGDVVSDLLVKDVELLEEMT